MPARLPKEDVCFRFPLRPNFVIFDSNDSIEKPQLLGRRSQTLSIRNRLL